MGTKRKLNMVYKDFNFQCHKINIERIFLSNGFKKLIFILYFWMIQRLTTSVLAKSELWRFCACKQVEIQEIFYRIESSLTNDNVENFNVPAATFKFHIHIKYYILRFVKSFSFAISTNKWLKFGWERSV